MADERRIITKVYYDTSGVLQGAEAAKAALASVGGETKRGKESLDSLTRQYQRLVGDLNPATKAQIGYARAVELTTRMVKEGKISQEQANATLRQAEAHYRSHAAQVSGLGGIYERLGGKIIAAAAAYKLLQLGRKAIDEAVDAAKAQALLESAVRSTGGAAGLTAVQLDDMASGLSRLTGVDDEVIAGAEAILLRYTRISGDAFPRAIKLALDMASAQGEQITSTSQLSSEVEKLGKMLGDPARAIALAKREGKGFDEQQIKLIQSSLKLNDLAGAQAVVFRKLEEQYGGTAEALREEVGGAIQAAQTAWGNLLEEFGKGFTVDVSGLNAATDALTDEDTLRATRELGEAVGLIADELARAAALAAKAGAGFLGLFLRRGAPAYTPTPNYTPTEPNFTPYAPPPLPPAPPAADPAAIAAAQRAAEQAQKHAEKLRDTYAQLLDKHEETKRVQQELTALYAQAGLTEAKQLAGEIKINAEHEERVARAKALVQFADLGAAEARRMADTLALINKEEADRQAHLDIQKTKIKDLAAGMEAAHKLAADRSAAAWKHALESLEAGLKPIREMTSEIRTLDQEVDFARRVGAIDAPTERLRAIEVDYLEFLRRIGQGSVEAGEKVFADMAVALGETVDTIKAKLGELQDRAAIAQVRGAGLTPSEINRGRVAELERLRGVAIDQAVRQGQEVLAIQRDFDAAIRAENERHWQEVTSGWAAGLSFLGGLFGGFVQQLADSISRIQGAYQQGKQLDASGFGSAAGLSGAFGGIFATAAIFAEIYKAVSLDIKRERARTFRDVTSTEVVDGEFSSPSYFDRAGREASFAIERMIQDLVDSLDAILDDLPQIVIRARRDGKEFSAYVAGVFVGTFRDAQTALEEAVATAIQQANFAYISEEFAIALRASVGATMEELESNLDTARSARRARLGDTGTQYVEVEDAWRREMDAARRLGLSIDDMIDARDREAGAIKANVLGIDTSVADQIRAIRSLNAGMAEAGRSQRAYTEQLIADTRRQIAELEARQRAADLGGGAGVVGGGGQGTGAGRPEFGERGDLGSAGRYTKEITDAANEQLEALRRSLANFVEELGEIPEALSDIEINMGITRALLTDLEGTGKYTAEARALAIWEVEQRYALIKEELILAGKWEQFAGMFDAAFAAARNEAERGPRRGGGGQREAARDWLDDNAFRLAAERMGEVERALVEMNRTYDDQAKEVRAGSAEMARLNAQRREEAELIRQRARDAAGQDLADYLGGDNAFTAERQRAGDLRKQWKDLLDSGVIKWKEYKAAMDAVNRALEDHLELLGMQESATLLGNLAGLLDQAGLAGTSEQLALIQAQQQANFALSLAQARADYARLVAEGELIGKNKQIVEDALKLLSGVDVTTLGGGPYTGPHFLGYDDAAVASPTADAYQEALRLREKYEDDLADQFRQRVEQIGEDFGKIFEQLGRGAENLALFEKAVKEAFGEELKEPVQEWLDSLGLSDLGALTGQQQLELASTRFDEIAARIAAGDFSAWTELAGAGDQLLDIAAGQYGTATSQYQLLLARVQAIGQQSLGLADAAAQAYIDSGAFGFGNVTPLQLATLPIVEAVSAAHKTAEAQQQELVAIKQIAETQAYLLSGVTAELAQLRAANDSLATELRLARNSR